MELTFRQMEKVFLQRFGISEPGEAAFRSRLQHLQRRKIFEDLNTGSGRKASYQWNHVILLMVTLDLIDLGMSPDVAVGRVTSDQDRIVYAAYEVIQGFKSQSKLVKSMQTGRCPISSTRFIFTSAAVLSFGGDSSNDGAYIEVLTYSALQERLRGDAAIEPAAALIDLGARLMLVAGLVGREATVRDKDAAADLHQWLQRWANEDALS